MDAPSEERFALAFDPDSYRRTIAGKDVIIHCHHYNARLQRAVEAAGAVNGRAIMVTSAEAVFAEQAAAAFHHEDDDATRRQVVEQLYAHLGYGRIDLSTLAEGVVRAHESHIVEGWRAGFADRAEPVCSVTVGYLQGTIAALTGDVVRVEETRCMIDGSDCCHFAIHHDRTTPLATVGPRRDLPQTSDAVPTLSSPSVDEKAIIDALVAMPIHGGEDGLIPGFNVYLANTPADLYNMICTRFVKEMTDKHLGEVARLQLQHVAETCAMNTFRGIMDSAEWEALVAPMVQDQRDELFGIIAVSNGLGWGNWRVAEHSEEESLTLVSLNGYEADGFLQMHGSSQSAECMMLSGVSAGIMELIYGDGSIEERFGQYEAAERCCRCASQRHCRFEVEAAA